MSRSFDTISHKKALLIICEGEVTEPLFFDGLRKRVKNCEVEILPMPRLHKEDVETSPSRGHRHRERRQLKNVVADEKVVFVGKPPLKWVDAGKERLDTYEEVWCVFDKDGHPETAAAFEKVAGWQAEGDNINIGFSSRCIEYYFLLHFEYLYRTFPKCECSKKVKGKTRYLRCLLPDADPKGCDGSKCINGYARSKGYWKESKDDTCPMYELLKDSLFIGISNASLLRRDSAVKEGGAPVYKRNPYVDVDRLVARLLGYTAIVEPGTSFDYKDGAARLKVEKDGNKLLVTNCGDVGYVMNGNMLRLVDKNTGEIGAGYAPDCIIEPGQSVSIDVEGQKGNLSELSFLRDKFLVVQ